MKIKFINCDELLCGIKEIAKDLGFEICDENADVTVTAVKSDKRISSVELNSKDAVIIYGDGKARFFRGLAHLINWLNDGESDKKLAEIPTFETNGSMIDMSRNAVMNVPTVKLLMRKMALMGMNTFMPEVGCQIPMMRIAVALARATAKAANKKWGVYYECWKNGENGETAYTQPVYGNPPYNDWNYTQDQFGDNFTTCGENGGSSRLLQRRIYFHALMSGAEFLAEEWGFVRSFYNMENYELSPYG